ncbi:CheR family methyltransferase [Ponticoccus sp. (in: a-proteobacteria)]|uniref:CheR family methyltransferase n=1 Tax=Ponticoccus sp. (in: a-proteobacteria) TaxID=1925025 RepID=UPI003AB4F35A
MTSVPRDAAATEIAFSDADFRAIAAIAQERFGLNLAESKKPLVYSRLSKRLKARNLNGFPDYLKLLEQPEETDERQELISALTTNVTSFFRETHHFETLASECLPALAAGARSGQRIRLWSAGCSSGQEPYSIAMSVLDQFPDAANLDLRILATDIDPQIVDRARTGSYPGEEAAGIPAPYQAKWVRRSGDGGRLTMGEPLRQLITFAELNLMDLWPFKGPFDVIFCRNVAIYFNQQTQQNLWQRFCQMLIPGGYLFIGHSERITGPATQDLSGVGITSYRKRPGPSGTRAQ